MLKGKNSNEEAYTRDDTGEVSIVVLTIVEEDSHRVGRHLMVVGDEAVLGAIDTFAGEQGADQEVAENVKKEIVCEASHYVPLVRGCLHFKEPTTKIHSLLTRSKEENNLTKIYQ
jgi:hypothetical protein